MSLFNEAIASSASTLTADGMTTGQIAAKMANALSYFGDYLGAFDIANKTKLAQGAIYVVHSGTGQKELADEFVKSVSNSGTIRNSDWGNLIDKELVPSELQKYVDSLNQAFGTGNLKFEGKPISVDTIKDIMWNYGSPSFMRNGGSPGSVVRGFIATDANPARGFGALELPVAINEQIPINGVAPASLDDAIVRSAAFGAAEEASLIAERAAHAVIPASRVMEIENDFSLSSDRLDYKTMD